MHYIATVFLIFSISLFPISIHSSVDVSAKSAIMIDAETGRIIYEKNAYDRLSMASTTKIITAITAIENGNLSDIVTISENAASTEGSSVWLEPGEKLTLSELLYAMMLESGNDASVAVAEHIGGSIEAFSVMMNETCKKAGAISTSCITPSGLDAEQHFTTAYDMAQIACHAMKSEIFREIVSTYKTTIPWEGKEWGRTLVNHNKLLNMYDGVDGIKTGYTKKSGRCLVSTAEKDGFRVIAVTLDAPDDWNDHIKLFEYAFSTYTEDEVLLTEGSFLGKIKILGNVYDEASYGADETVIIKKLGQGNVNISYELFDNLKAPMRKGDIVGKADISLNDRYYKTVNLVLLADVEKNSFIYIFNENFERLLKILLYSVR